MDALNNTRQTQAELQGLSSRKVRRLAAALLEKTKRQLLATTEPRKIFEILYAQKVQIKSLIFEHVTKPYMGDGWRALVFGHAANRENGWRDQQILDKAVIELYDIRSSQVELADDPPTE